jgi:transcription antitermination factor NusG
MRQWSDRKKKVVVPLFNSYVFVQIADSERNLVFQSVGAVRYLFWLSKPAIVRDEEISTIRKWLDTPDVYDVSIGSIQVGDKIILDSGPFSTQEAVVREVNKTHYVLVLETLGCVLKMKIK